MKYLLIALLLVGCGGTKQDAVEAEELPVIEFHKVEMLDLEIRDPELNGGTTEQDGDNWKFVSHTNLACIDELKGSCRKADVIYQEGLSVEDRIVKYSFVLNVVEFPVMTEEDHFIIFQDWTRLIVGLSNHPITTLKLKNLDGLSLCSYNNTWQFDWTDPDWGHVSDGSIHDHPDEELNGCTKIDVGVDYYVEFYIYDNGQVKLVVDEVTIFDVEYKTKGVNDHVIMWGLYWSKGFNLSFDPTQRAIATMENFTRYEN